MPTASQSIPRIHVATIPIKILIEGKTTIMIAHRLSTIRDCDMIIVMENGCIREQGTHDELYAKGGLYSALISNE